MLSSRIPRTAYIALWPPIASLVLAALFSVPARAQSTFGSIVGTVRDPSGASVSGCTIVVVNTGSSTRRTTLTDDTGSYSVLNLDPSTYDVTMEAPGFQRSIHRDVVLRAQQVARLDDDLVVATRSDTVTVSVSRESSIQTEVSNIAETKTGRELVDLPVAIATRGAGSTSPMSTLTVQPSVQTDPKGGISVGGGRPSELSMTLDGISSMGPKTAGPIVELFPSFYAIAEIRINQSNNKAEFGGASDITTISKSGTNNLHGGAFENLQNTDLVARNPFSSTVPQLNMNDFGAYFGGPVSIPKLYEGRNRTFFFMSYEGLRLKTSTLQVESVPSLGLRTGDLSSYLPKTFNAPGTGVPFANNRIPLSQIDPIALKALQYLFPLPNAVSSNINANNFIRNFPTPITSDQGDMRLDQTISPKQAAYARFTYKRREVITTSTGSALLGGVSQPEIDYGLTAAHNYVISPNVINELRAGFNGSHTRTAFGITAQQIASEIGLTGLPQELPTGSAFPNFAITGFQATGGQNSNRSVNNSYQALDTLTWARRGHTIKFGGDYRRLNGYYSDSKLSLRLGQYTYNGGVTNLGLNGSSASATNPAFIGNPFAAFLLGVPDQTRVSTVTEADANAYSNAYGSYVQDDWKITPRLTLNIGLRYEYHPMFVDRKNNVANFLPDYKSIVNGVGVNGAVIVPNDGAVKILNPAFVESISPTPIFEAKQLGLPERLRYSQKTDFAPRFGFAWRPSADGKTVIRGGYGKYLQGPMGSVLSALWSISATFAGLYTQKIVNGVPQLAFPHPFPADIAQPGSEVFNAAADLHYKDPFIQQWNLTIERELGFNTTLRATYSGTHGSDLGVDVNYAQLPANTAGFTQASKSAPYPLWAGLLTSVNLARSNYNALTLTGTRRFAAGLQFQASYVWAKNLSNEAGFAPTAYAGERGGQLTDRFNPGLDYGNVSYTRHQRFLVTFLYELPFRGRGQLSQIVEGWELAGVILVQSGPFLTPTAAGADPSGTGFPVLTGDGRPDRVSGVSIYPQVQTPGSWLNRAAFAVPQNSIGRFGNAPVGAIVGPGTQAVSASLIKSIRIAETARFYLGGQVANLFNHPNYAPPNTSLTSAAFGTITGVQTAEGAGPRVLQLTARFVF